MSVLTLDLETTTKTSYKRKANPFDPENYIVAWGLGYSDRDSIETYYMEEPPRNWLDGVNLIVGHNIKFDLLYIWDREDLKQFLKRGGMVFDTQFAEYLLTGQRRLYASLDDCSAKYGGKLKNDEIKAMWEAGIDTPAIPKDMLLDYLEGDIRNTQIVYKAQVERMKKLGLSATIKTHMEGLLAITEMEYNGMYIDTEQADKQRQQIEIDLENVKKELEKYIPELPEELEWNWGSKDHLSALLFGGQLKYKKRVHIQDEEGNYLYTKKKEDWYLKDGEPFCKVPDESGDTNFTLIQEVDGLDVYLSGKKKGMLKTKKVDVQGDPKMRYEDYYVCIEGQAEPLKGWTTKKEGVYKTDDKVLKVLAQGGVEVAELMQEWRKLDKDLGTYYRRYDPKKKCDVGMLTLVQADGIIHHKLNNTNTVTGRLSSSDPNLQNVSSGDKSEIKRVFSSRWGEQGKIGQIDFSQLEVVVKAFESQDPAMLQDVRDGVDQHCKKLAFKLGEDYEHVLHKCKVEEDDWYVLQRKKAKPISFQKAYGAMPYSVAQDLGMDIEEVQAFFDAEDKAYPIAKQWESDVEDQVNRSRKLTNKKVEIDGVMCTIGVGYYVGKTGKRYVFEESKAPDSMRKPRNPKQLKVYTNFPPTQMKNYPIQGLAGELVWLALGKIYREFLKRDNFGGKALLVNTIHDSIIQDAHESVAEESGKLIKECCERVPEYYEERYGHEFNTVLRADLEIGNNLLELVTIK